MLLPDVNVLVYAHRADASTEHPAYASWITRLATAAEPFALSALVVVGVVRIVTNPRIFRRPSTLDEVFAFLDELLTRPNARIVTPGAKHLEIWQTLCRESRATGKLVADAQHAALAIEHGCTFVTTDSDFSRFPELRWIHPLRATPAS